MAKNDRKTIAIICPKCEESKPPSEFYEDSHNQRLYGWCRQCVMARNMAWKRENPDAVREIGRRYRSTYVDRTKLERQRRYRERKKERRLGNRAAVQREERRHGTREENSKDAAGDVQ